MNGQAQRAPVLVVAFLILGGVALARLVADVMYDPVVEAERIADEAGADA
jgi:hypothetical protein